MSRFSRLPGISDDGGIRNYAVGLTSILTTEREYDHFQRI